MTDFTPAGLKYIPNVLPDNIYHKVIRFLIEQKFQPITNSKNSRCVLQYGYQYDYFNRDAPKKIEPIPPLLTELLSYTLLDNLEFDQCIINRYLPGQGISEHIDSGVFSDTIVCFTICGGAYLQFKNGERKFNLYTEPNSLYIMQGESRYKWTHAMVGRLNDVVGLTKIPRMVRYSITFRKLKGKKA